MNIWDLLRMMAAKPRDERRNGGKPFGEKWGERQQVGRGRTVRGVHGPSLRAERLIYKARTPSKGDKSARAALYKAHVPAWRRRKRRQ